MADVLEIAGSPDVSLRQFLPLAFHLLLFLVKATVHHVVHVGIVMEAHIVNFWVLDVHRRHWQRGSIWWVTSFLGFLLSSAEEVIKGNAESFCFLFISKIQANLARIPWKCDKVRS